MVVVGQDDNNLFVLDPGYDPGDNDPQLMTIPKQDFLKEWWYPPFHPCWIIG
jgi:hypothetical protein